MIPRTIPFNAAIASLLVTLSTAEPAPDLPVEVLLSPTGHPTLTFPASADNYYRLLRLDAPLGASRAVSLARGVNGPLTLRDPLPAFGRTFYKVETIPNTAPLDYDDDGIDDLTELQGLPLDNPLNAGPRLMTNRGAAYIPDRATYETLARRENVPGAINIREVKFVILDAHTDKPRLSFVNTNRYEFHYNFSRDVLRYRGSNSQFNNETYFNDSRRKNLAGSFLSHENYELGDGRKGIYTMEFWPTDPVGFSFVHKAYQLLTASLPFIETRLVYHPNGQTQRTIFER
ncbi:MAG: hypothetical protein P8J87_06150, partial [Verrucomicrobiales bacterium]|nr:hypothetical protein [Verrucomicrobiales bacterium]